jgi:hypothetical protein
MSMNFHEQQRVSERTQIFRLKQIQNVIVILLVPISAIAGFFLINPHTVEAQALRSTRLDATLINSQSRIIDNILVESIFKAKVRAYGGDIYLPAYSEEIIYSPAFISSLEKSNAIIPGSATISITEDLPSEKGRYVLKEYEEANITITVTSRIIPSAMTSDRLVFRTVLKSLVWKPVVQEYNEDAVGNPLLDVSPMDWETNPVIVWKKMPTIAIGLFGQSNKIQKKNVGTANVFGAFRQLGEIFR